MEKLTGILQVVLPVVTMIMIGVLVRKTQMIGAETIDQLKSFLMKICLPCLLFKTFYAVSISWREGVVLLIFALVTLTGYFCGCFISKKLGITWPLAPFMCSTIEGGSIGYALFILLYGEEHLYRLALMDVGNAITQWAVVMTLLQIRLQGSTTKKEVLKSIISPITCSIAAGVFCSVTGIGVRFASTGAGLVLESVLSFVGAPVGAMIILTVGYGLTFKGIAWKDTMKLVGMRAALFAAMGAVVYMLISRLFPGDMLYSAAAILFFVLPPTYAYAVMIKDPDDNAALSAFLGIYTLLTIAAYTLFVAVTI